MRWVARSVPSASVTATTMLRTIAIRWPSPFFAIAVVDRRAAGEVAAVALAADAVDELAGQCGTDLHFLNAGLLQGVDMRLLHQRAALDHDLVGRGIAQILAG